MAWAGAWGGQQAGAWGGGGGGGGGNAGWGMQAGGMGGGAGYAQQQMGGYQQQQQQQQQQQFAQQAQQAQPQAAAGWGGGMAQTAQAAKPAAQMQAAAPQAQASDKGGETLVVTGCTHATVGGIVRGTFQLSGDNHGKPAYKKDGQVNGLDVMCYFWDERDGPGFCGWWFGPVIGGDQVWAYHTDKSAPSPPGTGWKVPYDGPVDPTLVITSKPKAGGGGAMAPAQSQWSPQTQTPQGNAWNAQQQMQQEQQRKLMEQRKAMEEMKRRQEEAKKNQALENQKKMEELKKKQMEEQQRKLEENRKKLAEANNRRMEEQKKKMEEMKRKQDEIQQKREAEKKRMEEELKKKQEEMKAKQAEQQSVLKLRRALQKYKAAMPHNIEAFDKEFDETVTEETPKLVSQKENIEKEIEQARSFVKTKLDNIEKKKKEEEEKKKAEEEKRKKMRADAEKYIKELTTLVEAAEEASKGVTEEAEPFTTEGKEMTLKELESAGQAVEQAGKDFEEKQKACKEFADKNAGAMKNAPAIPGEPAPTSAQDLGKLLGRMNVMRSSTAKTMATAAAAKEDQKKKAEAKTVFEKQQAVFKKYDSDKDGFLSRREIMNMCKGAYSFSCPNDAVDLICKVLVPEGGKGVAKTDLQRLKVMIGMAREKVMDDKRRDNRLAKEKKLADLKTELEEKIAEATKIVSGANEELQKIEKHQTTLPGQGKVKAVVKAAEMITAADETEGMINEAKASVASGKEGLKGLEIEVEDELKNFLAASVKRLTGQLQGLDTRITKTTAFLTKYRADISKRDLAELESLWAEALTLLRYHQTVKKLKNDTLFDSIDKKKTGKIQEKAFTQFFKTCERPKSEKVSDDGTKEEVEDELKLSDEDLSRLFTHLDSEEKGSIPKESFVNMVRQFMKVVKATVISDSMSIKTSKTVRRLEPDEVVEVIQGPITEEDIGVARLNVKCVSDNKEGWLTPVGNQGTVFLKEGGGTMKVVKETILTGSFLIGGKDDKKTKKLKEGEVVEIREWGRKEESSGLTRMKVKVKSDGSIGWVTSIGNTGIVFLEMV